MPNFIARKNVAYDLYFPIFDVGTGAFLSGAVISSIRICNNGVAYAPATNAAAELGADATYHLVVTAPEMNSDFIMVRVVSNGKPVWVAIETWDAIMNKQADHTLRRHIATARASIDGDTPIFRSLLGAVSKLVNRVRVLAGFLTVYEENDTTAFGGQAVTATPADPIVELDTT